MLSKAAVPEGEGVRRPLISLEEVWSTLLGRNYQGPWRPPSFSASPSQEPKDSLIRSSSRQKRKDGEELSSQRKLPINIIIMLLYSSGVKLSCKFI